MMRNEEPSCYLPLLCLILISQIKFFFILPFIIMININVTQIGCRLKIKTKKKIRKLYQNGKATSLAAVGRLCGDSFHRCLFNLRPLSLSLYIYI